MSSGAVIQRLHRFTSSGSAHSDKDPQSKGRKKCKRKNSGREGSDISDTNEESSMSKIELPSVYLGGTGIVIQPESTSSNRNDSSNINVPFRRCCLFWTCCCRCACLNVRHPNNDIPRNDGHTTENEPAPSIEDIRAWGDSFDRLMKWSVGRKAFRDFLKCEYSEENILFWQACEELKKEDNPSAIEEKARLIYEDYISILSPKEVSLDSRVREVINRNMVSPSSHTFDEAQTQIYTLMHRDSYPRFINSPYYKKLAQLNTNGNGASNRKTSTA